MDHRRIAPITGWLWIVTFITSIPARFISTLRQDAPSGLDAALGQGLEAVYEWSFRLGPGFVVGVGNGLILGWLMYRSELVPRGLAIEAFWELSIGIYLAVKGSGLRPRS
jgi:hypothetical protein